MESNFEEDNTNSKEYQIQVLKQLVKKEQSFSSQLAQSRSFSWPLSPCPKSYQSHESSFLPTQDEIRVKDRNEVVRWLHEVCLEQKWNLEHFVLAVNIMDKFLSVCKIKLKQLQLLSVACFTVSIKEKQSYVSKESYVSKLIKYSDNSIRPKEIKVSTVAHMEFNMLYVNYE